MTFGTTTPALMKALVSILLLFQAQAIVISDVPQRIQKTRERVTSQEYVLVRMRTCAALEKHTSDGRHVCRAHSFQQHAFAIVIIIRYGEVRVYSTCQHRIEPLYRFRRLAGVFKNLRATVTPSALTFCRRASSITVGWIFAAVRSFNTSTINRHQRVFHTCDVDSYSTIPKVSTCACRSQLVVRL